LTNREVGLFYYSIKAPDYLIINYLFISALVEIFVNTKGIIFEIGSAVKLLNMARNFIEKDKKMRDKPRAIFRELLMYLRKNRNPLL
jgi:hypothetical protein